MATWVVKVLVTYEPEGGGITIISTAGSDSTTAVAQGDSIRFGNNASSAFSIVVEDFLTAVYTSSSKLSVGIGSNGTRTVKSNGTLGDHVLTIVSNGKQKTRTITIVGNDTTPDPFSFNQRTNTYPSNTYITFTSINGTNTVTSGSCSGGTMSLDGVNWSTSIASIPIGARIYSKIVASATLGAPVTNNITIGGVAASPAHKVTNFSSYPAQEVIPLGITSGTIWLSDLQVFFGASQWITGFYRNGSLVPTVPSYNDNIPTSGEIWLSDFYGSATALYWTTGSPQAKFDTKIGNGSNQTVSLQWTVGTDFDVGFGAGLLAVCEKRYTISYDYGLGTFTSESGNPTVFSVNNDWVKIEKTMVGGEVEGTITIYIKHPKDTGETAILQHTFAFTLIIAT